MISEQSIRDALAAEAETIEVPQRAPATLIALATESTIVSNTGSTIESTVERGESNPFRGRRSPLVIVGTLAAGIALGAGFVGPLRTWLQSEPQRPSADGNALSEGTVVDSDESSSTFAATPDDDSSDRGGSAAADAASRTRALSAAFTLSVDADHVDNATERVIAITHASNGTVESALTTEASGESAYDAAFNSATMKLSIPTASFTTFVGQLGDVGTISSVDEREVDTELEYESLLAQQQLLDQSVLAYQAEIARADGEDSVQGALQQLADALQQLAAVERRLRELRQSTQYVTVTVVLRASA